MQIWIKIGKKINKDRISVAFLCYQTGDEYFKPIVINNNKEPRCFGKYVEPNTKVSFYFNDSAWMTILLFEDCVEKFNREMARQNRKVILLLDNAGGHSLSK